MSINEYTLLNKETLEKCFISAKLLWNLEIRDSKL